MARLRQECIDAKEALSSDTDVSIPVLLPNLQTEVRLTRSEFESMVRPALSETITALRRAIRSASVADDDISAVLLVGGSSRIPLVAQMVAAELGRPIAIDAHPKDAISFGAAIAVAARKGQATPESVKTVLPSDQRPPPPTVAPTGRPRPAPPVPRPAPPPPRRPVGAPGPGGPGPGGHGDHRPAPPVAPAAAAGAAGIGALGLAGRARRRRRPDLPARPAHRAPGPAGPARPTGPAAVAGAERRAPGRHRVAVRPARRQRAERRAPGTAGPGAERRAPAAYGTSSGARPGRRGARCVVGPAGVVAPARIPAEPAHAARGAVLRRPHAPGWRLRRRLRQRGRGRRIARPAGLRRRPSAGLRRRPLLRRRPVGRLPGRRPARSRGPTTRPCGSSWASSASSP